MIINLPKKTYVSDNRVRNISKSFTHKMAAKTSWHDMKNEITSLSAYVFASLVKRLNLFFYFFKTKTNIHLTRFSCFYFCTFCTFFLKTIFI